MKAELDLSPRRRFVSACALRWPLVFARAVALFGAALPLACESAATVPAQTAREPTPQLASPPSVTDAGSPWTSDGGAASSPVTAPTVAIPAASASEALAPSPVPSAEPVPPCIDGEILMGACICDKGKTVDETGHCVYPPCPKSSTGGTAFRDESTGQCMECPGGTRPTKDGKCEH